MDPVRSRSHGFNREKNIMENKSKFITIIKQSSLTATCFLTGWKHL